MLDLPATNGTLSLQNSWALFTHGHDYIHAVVRRGLNMQQQLTVGQVAAQCRDCGELLPPAENKYLLLSVVLKATIW